MFRPPHDYQTLFWLTLASATVAVIARGWWLYRASLAWPTGDGAITLSTLNEKLPAARIWSACYGSNNFIAFLRDFGY